MKWFVCFVAAIVLYACSSRQYELQKKYDHPFFHAKSWSYIWYMIKDDNGHFDSGLTDSLGNLLIDTTHYMHTAQCTVNDSDFDMFKYADASVYSDSLSIHFYDLSNMYGKDLFVYINKGQTNAHLTINYIFAYDPKDVSWTTVKKKIVLDSDRFHKGDTLKGYLDLEIVEQWRDKTGPERKRVNDTIYIKGPFKTVIKGAAKAKQ